jgi:hypothetical protein
MPGCLYIQCRYAENRVLFIIMLSVVMLNAVAPRLLPGNNEQVTH